VGFRLLATRSMPRVLLSLGSVSYALYLTHTIVIKALDGASMTGWLLVASAVVASIALAAIVHVWVEKPSIAIGLRMTPRKV